MIKGEGDNKYRVIKTRPLVRTVDSRYFENFIISFILGLLVGGVALLLILYLELDFKTALFIGIIFWVLYISLLPFVLRATRILEVRGTDIIPLRSSLSFDRGKVKESISQNPDTSTTFYKSPKYEKRNFVTSEGSKSYHLPTCRLAKIIKSKKIFSDSEEKLKLQGLKRCKVCLK